MSINLELEPNISINDIQAAMADGFSVMRSAHVGNQRGYNLALTEAGVPMVLLDHNAVAQYPEDLGDKNYLPGSIVARTEIMPLSIRTLGGLVLRTPLSNGQYLDEFHIASLRSAFPENESVITQSTYQRLHESILSEIIDCALDIQPELFQRKIEADEADAVKAAPDSSFASDAAFYGMLPLKDDPRTERGLIVPNEVTMMTYFVAEALRSGRDVQIHLSGPDMQHYTKNPHMLQALHELYQTVRERTSFGGQLPETLTVRLVPTNYAQFVTTETRKEPMQRLFELIAQRREEIEGARNEFFRTDHACDAATKKAFLASVATRDQVITTNTHDVLAELSEILGGPTEAPFLSQYDVLAEGRLYIPKENRTMTMQELKNLAKILAKIRGEKKICVNT